MFDDDPESLYEAIFEGRMKAVGWGAIAAFPYYQLHCPFPIDYLVDSDVGKWGSSIDGVPIRSPEALRDEPPGSVVVIVFPFYDKAIAAQILLQLKSYGQFRAIPPISLERDRALVRSAMERCLVRTAQEASDLSPALQRARAVLNTPVDSTLQEHLRTIRARHRRNDAPSVRRRVRLVIGCLQPGGAERQICYLAVGLKQRGWDVALLSFAPPQAGAEHYADLLKREGVPLEVLPSAREIFSGLQSDPEFFDLFQTASPILKRLPLYMIHWTIAAFRRFSADRPSLVVAYLDPANIATGLGALLAGVDHVALSGRNVHPGNFPNLYLDGVDWIRDLYGEMSLFPEVRISANSIVGAHSYAEWIGLPHEAVAVVPNGIPPDSGAPPADTIRAVRAELAVGGDTPLIVGVFRLAEEKQPLLFVDVVQRLHAAGAVFKAALVGDGPMAPAMRERIEQAGLSERLRLLGVREDVRAVLAAADLVLHVARVEGHPNVLLEAQLLGKPIVTTAAGGTVEVLAPMHLGQVCPSGRADELAERCQTILGDLAEAKQRSAAAGAWVADRFSIANLVTNTLIGAGLPEDA
ncbi:glycosyltransferase [Azospirillum formosense]|uniref:glycosyltransferase n=1 Tax=Azospirillum formosense TaxID=861533 RepID=UPI00338E94DC